MSTQKEAREFQLAEPELEKQQLSYGHSESHEHLFPVQSSQNSSDHPDTMNKNAFQQHIITEIQPTSLIVYSEPQAFKDVDGSQSNSSSITYELQPEPSAVTDSQQLNTSSANYYVQHPCISVTTKDQQTALLSVTDDKQTSDDDHEMGLSNINDDLLLSPANDGQQPVSSAANDGQQPASSVSTEGKQPGVSIATDDKQLITSTTNADEKPGHFVTHDKQHGSSPATDEEQSRVAAGVQNKSGPLATIIRPHRISLTDWKPRCLRAPVEEQLEYNDHVTIKEKILNFCRETDVLNRSICTSADMWLQVSQNVLLYHPKKHEMELKMSVSPLRIADHIENANKKIGGLKNSLYYTRKLFQLRKFQVVWHYQALFETARNICDDFERFKNAIEYVEEEHYTREMEELSDDLQDSCHSIKAVLSSISNVIRTIGKMNIADDYFETGGAREDDMRIERRSHVVVEEYRGNRRKWWHWRTIWKRWWCFVENKWVRYCILPGMLLFGSAGLVIVFILHGVGFFDRGSDFNLTSSGPGVDQTLHNLQLYLP